MMWNKAVENFTQAGSAKIAQNTVTSEVKTQ